MAVPRRDAARASGFTPEGSADLNTLNPEYGCVRVRAWGPTACFTRYDTPAERDTYPMLTVPAADGILSSVYWHPGFHYEITQMAVLNPVQLYTWHGTELKTRPGRGGTDVLDNRTPRTKRLIHEPAYLIEARLVLRPELRPDARHWLGKYHDILRKRLNRGQVYEQPFFGQREYACHIEPATGNETPWKADADLGPFPLHLRETPDPRGPLILTRHHHDVAEDRWVRQTYRGRVEPTFFPATVRGGVLQVPAYRERS